MKINELSCEFKKLEKEQLSKPNKSTKNKRLIKIKSEIYKRENKKSRHNLKSLNLVAKINNPKLAL